MRILTAQAIRACYVMHGAHATTSCKNTETFYFIEAQTVSRDHVHSIPLPPPLLKFDSDAKSYSKLEPTSSNGGECMLLKRCIY